MSVHRFYQKSPVAECRSRVIVVFLIEYQVVPHLHACEMQAGSHHCASCLNLGGALWLVNHRQVACLGQRGFAIVEPHGFQLAFGGGSRAFRHVCHHIHTVAAGLDITHHIFLVAAVGKFLRCRRNKTSFQHLGSRSRIIGREREIMKMVDGAFVVSRRRHVAAGICLPGTRTCSNCVQTDGYRARLSHCRDFHIHFRA